jgi:hemoglobin-like flavoprotein
VRQLSLKLVKSENIIPAFKIDLTEHQKTLVIKSFAAFEPDIQHLSKVFFHRLAEIEPWLGAQLPNETNVHSDKLATIIQIAVISIRNLDALVPMLKLLGSEYRSYGARPEYYEIFGDVLLWTLEQSLGDAYTDEVNEAWATLYGILSEMMMHTDSAATASTSTG